MRVEGKQQHKATLCPSEEDGGEFHLGAKKKSPPCQHPHAAGAMEHSGRRECVAGMERGEAK